MITSPIFHHILFIFIFTFALLFPTIFALNADGTSLLSLKHNQQTSSLVFHTWNQTDVTPCSWYGVTCAPRTGSVIALHLCNANLTGSIPEELGSLRYLRSIDLSNNSINGTLPNSLSYCLDLETINLSVNKISGELPERIGELQSLRILNISNNEFSGGVPRGFTTNLVLDLSYNNFSGEVPPSLGSLDVEYLAGNRGLCGKPLDKMCIVPSFHSNPPNVTSYGSATAAIAAIPKTTAAGKSSGGRKVKIGKIVGIVVGDLAAIMVFTVILFYAYKLRKTKCQNAKEKESENANANTNENANANANACLCFAWGLGEEMSETATEVDSVAKSDEKEKCLVMVDGETELEMETLFKASAYILGSSGGSIVYKTVIGGRGDGNDVAFAVRRIGECRVEKMGEFEKIVRVLAKFRHENLVKVCGFVWGEEEKLVIYDYVSNGSLATSSAYKKVGTSSSHLSFEVRLKVAKGIAKGLAYIHEKKHVHGNIKPSNILLTLEMDPLISDFGLDWLTSGKTNCITNKLTRTSDSKKSTSSREETINNRDHPHSTTSINTYVTPPTGLHRCILPYQAPESTKTVKPNPKWDVYSFGIILLELLLGKVLSGKELGQWNIGTSNSHHESKILKMVDGFVTNDLDKKESILTCFKLGFSCASLAPQKRPSMKEVLQILEKIPCLS